MVKICKKCNIRSNNFDKDSSRKDGYHPYCKICRKKKSQKYYKTNKNKILKNQYKYYDENKKNINIKTKEYYIKNKEKKLNYSKKYYNTNKTKLQIHRTKYQKRKRKEDINFKLSSNLRTRLSDALKNNTKKGSAVRDLGCSIDEFKVYLESKFQLGMTWDNYGIKGWHIDHIIPLSKFNLLNKREIKIACHYTNLQPLWAEDNFKKGNRF